MKIEPFRFLEELNFGREEIWGDVTIVLPFTNAMVTQITVNIYPISYDITI